MQRYLFLHVIVRALDSWIAVSQGKNEMQRFKRSMVYGQQPTLCIVILNFLTYLFFADSSMSIIPRLIVLSYMVISYRCLILSLQLLKAVLSFNTA